MGVGTVFLETLLVKTASVSAHESHLHEQDAHAILGSADEDVGANAEPENEADHPTPIRATTISAPSTGISQTGRPAEMPNGLGEFLLILIIVAPCVFPD